MIFARLGTTGGLGLLAGPCSAVAEHAEKERVTERGLLRGFTGLDLSPSASIGWGTNRVKESITERKI